MNNGNPWEMGNKWLRTMIAPVYHVQNVSRTKLRNGERRWSSEDALSWGHTRRTQGMSRWYLAGRITDNGFILRAREALNVLPSVSQICLCVESRLFCYTCVLTLYQQYVGSSGICQFSQESINSCLCTQPSRTLQLCESLSEHFVPVSITRGPWTVSDQSASLLVLSVRIATRGRQQSCPPPVIFPWHCHSFHAQGHEAHWSSSLMHSANLLVFSTLLCQCGGWWEE